MFTLCSNIMNISCFCATGLITFTVLFYGVFLTTVILLYIFYAKSVSVYLLSEVMFRMVSLQQSCDPCDTNMSVISSRFLFSLCCSVCTELSMKCTYEMKCLLNEAL